MKRQMVSKNLVTKILGLVLVFGLMFGATVAKAADKIALVSLQRALNEVEEGKKAKAQIQKEMDAKDREMKTLEADFKKKAQELSNQSSVLSPDALSAKQMELQNRAKTEQEAYMKWMQQMRTRQTDSANSILTSLRAVISDIAKKEGFNLVIENSAETVLYSDSAVDITTKVISAYNTRGK